MFCLALFSEIASAQDVAPEQIMNRASQYYLGSKDEILIKVNILGFVKRPGQYLVPRHTDLLSLVSFAGGPADGANMGKVQIIRQGEAGFAKDGQNGHNGHTDDAPMLTVDVKKYLETGKQGLIPTLESGDTVMIGQTFGSKLKNFLGANSLITVMLAVSTLILTMNTISK